MSAHADLDRAVHRRRKLSWAVYDWANSAVVTLVIAAVFPVYYNAIAQPVLEQNAASAFSFSITLALLLSGLAGPVIGTLGDILGARKRLLIIATLAGAIATMAMFTIESGAWFWASVLFIAVQIGLNTALGLYDALLSHVAPEAERDRLSALGYALGYVGGGVQLALSVAVIIFWERLGLPDQPTATRLALLFAGIWWLLFALPLFIFVPEPPAAPLTSGATGNAIRDTFIRLRNTFREIRSYGELFKMLIAFLIYSEGIGTIIQLATTYGRQQIGLDQNTLIGALLLTQFVAFPYALIFGRLPNAGARHRDFFVAFMLWTTVTFPFMGVLAAAGNFAATATFALIAANQVIGLALSWFMGRKLVTPIVMRLNVKTSIIFGLLVYIVIACWGFFLYTAAEFWLLAFMVGTVQGGTQALSRSLYSNLSPRSKSGEFFGFYGFADKFAGILGPLLFGIIGLGGNLRPAILSVIIFFVLGGLLLTRVNVERGVKHAEAEDAEIGYPDELPTVHSQPSTV